MVKSARPPWPVCGKVCMNQGAGSVAFPEPHRRETSMPGSSIHSNSIAVALHQVTRFPWPLTCFGRRLSRFNLSTHGMLEPSTGAFSMTGKLVKSEVIPVEDLGPESESRSCMGPRHVPDLQGPWWRQIRREGGLTAIRIDPHGPSYSAYPTTGPSD